MKQTVLERFKTTLEERLMTLKNHISIANNSILEINHQQKGDVGDFVASNTQGVLDASILYQYQVEVRMIENSLYKIKNGLFGICEMCGDEIDEDRLWVKPHAQYCISCREIYEKNL